MNKAVIMTPEWWFPGGVIHEVELLVDAGSFVKVRGSKPFLWWTIHRDFWISSTKVMHRFTA